VDSRGGLGIAKRKFSAHLGIEHRFSYHSIVTVICMPSEQLSSQSELPDRPILWQLIKQGKLGQACSTHGRNRNMYKTLDAKSKEK
jgi:hypothetical protein